MPISVYDICCCSHASDTHTRTLARTQAQMVNGSGATTWVTFLTMACALAGAMGHSERPPGAWSETRGVGHATPTVAWASEVPPGHQRLMKFVIFGPFPTPIYDMTDGKPHWGTRRSTDFGSPSGTFGNWMARIPYVDLIAGGRIL
jgi:hypothetical protein